jgi:NAD(P)-dependent dehydrogenase (short-subunit alcohol dehydrogenase family)
MMEEKVAIITGGSGGIGLEAARLLSAKGVKVLITGRQASRLKEIEASHSNIKSLVADASDPDAASKTVAAALERWGRIDIIINNAGGGAIQNLSEASVKSVEDIFSVNVTGLVLLSAAALPHLEQTKGTIINISSTYGSKAAAGLSLYAASKAAVEHLTRCWALELAPKGIRVNAVASGPVETAFLSDRMKLTDEQIERVKEQERQSIPMGRRGEPHDVAQWIVKLADPESSWITGQIIGVDGGLVIA